MVNLLAVEGASQGVEEEIREIFPLVFQSARLTWNWTTFAC